MELIHMSRERLASLPAALPMKAYDTDLAEIAANEYPSAVYVNRSTWHVLTEHSRRAMLATTLEEIPVLLVEIEESRELAAAIVYSGGINSNLAGTPDSQEDSVTLARYAWKLFQTEAGRALLLTMGAEPQYWLDLFDYLAGQAKEEAAPVSPAPTPSPQTEGLDIPLLELAGQATREDIQAIEFLAWGTQARNKPLKATHFYVDDSRFRAIEGKPESLKEAGVQVAIEANYSTLAEMPRALVLADIYKKRRLAADWIGQGIKIIVDLNIARDFFADALLGVPKGWRVYANRYYADDPAHLLEAYELAKAHAGEDILYIVYGTSGAKKLCEAHNWLFLNAEKSTGWIDGKAFIDG